MPELSNAVGRDLTAVFSSICRFSQGNDKCIALRRFFQFDSRIAFVNQLLSNGDDIFAFLPQKDKSI